MAGRKLNRYRKRQLALRAKLQKKGTTSAKRLLKKQSRKESRRARDINHVISKRIVTEAERTSRGIGMEDLACIRQRVRLRKPQRVALHSWACCSSIRPAPPGCVPSAGTPTRQTGSPSRSLLAGRAGSLPMPTGMLPATSRPVLSLMPENWFWFK
jgi:IS605 OrfB family transposase